MDTVKQLTKKQAIELYNSRFWEKMSYEERAKFQMVQDRMCMPIDIFSEAMSKYLGRPVYTHEFAFSNKEKLMAEVFDGAPAPSFDEIISLIPADKLVIVTK
jgi:aminopeptidase C